MNPMLDVLAWIGNRIGKPRGWERVVRLFTSPERCRELGETRVLRDGSVFIVQPGLQLGWQVRVFGTYEPELRAVFRDVLSSGAVAVDVGANVGWHTLLMARLVGEGGRVLAIEANPSVRARLVEHLALNHVEHVEVVPCAVGDSEGTVAFRAPDASDASAGDGHVLAANEAAGKDVIRVPTRTLDAIVEASGVERLDLIKIDVEGFEWPVLAGSTRSIERFRPRIVFEYIDEYAGRGGATPRAIADYFAQRRYQLFVVGRGGPRPISAACWPPAANLLAVPASRSQH